MPQSVTLPGVPRHLDEELRKVLLNAILELGNQAALAQNLGVDQATVSRWIAGRQGMDPGQCLIIARLTHSPIEDILRWAHHDPSRYLDSPTLPQLRPDSMAIADRSRLTDWESRRSSLPEKIRPAVDKAVRAVLESYQEAYELVDIEPEPDLRPTTGSPRVPRSRAKQSSSPAKNR